MPPQALELALAASIYPPAVVAVIALGRGPQLRSRVVVFVLAAAIITCASGVLMLFLLDELGATGPHHWTPSAAFDLALGVVLIGLAFYLRKKRPERAAPSGPSKLERYLESRRLTFVLGITLYVVPSPIYIAAVKTIADAQLSTSSELLSLAVIVAVMLWLIEVPMLLLLAVPGRASGVLERANLWFTEHGRLLAIVVSAGAGLYLAIKGLVNLIS
ncbi:MAG TPA: GAP family protein [Solirubrobacteraceae bacterium]|nr:GAP family protein [Solirubrobacteraceae bacterium]